MNHPGVTNISIDSLIEAKNNPNVMTKHEFASLVHAINEEGFLAPILIYPDPDIDGKFRIIDGHHRTRAAKHLGMSAVTAVVMDCDPQREVVLRIALNKIRGELDLTDTALALKELRDAGISMDTLALTGFSGAELSDMLRAHSVNVDEVTAAMDVPAPDYEVEEEVAKPLILELRFFNKEDLKKAKKALKHAAGKGKDMAEGLLRLIGEDVDEKEASA